MQAQPFSILTVVAAWMNRHGSMRFGRRWCGWQNGNRKLYTWCSIRI